MNHKSYFDGAVQSLGFSHAGGDATVGVMEPGSYTFSTGAPERMQVVAGVLGYRLPDGEWKTAKAGEQFNIAGNLAKFEFRAEGQVAYVCWFG